jgi:hypothetical protein
VQQVVVNGDANLQSGGSSSSSSSAATVKAGYHNAYCCYDQAALFNHAQQVVVNWDANQHATAEEAAGQGTVNGWHSTMSQCLLLLR